MDADLPELCNRTASVEGKTQGRTNQGMMCPGKETQIAKNKYLPKKKKKGTFLEAHKCKKKIT